MGDAPAIRRACRESDAAFTSRLSEQPLWWGRMIDLRRATVGDVEGIDAVVRGTWAQETLPEICQAQIEADTSVLWVVEEKNEILGFVSAFLTVDKAGRRRWEMDLVAVRPDSRGNGLGGRLIRQAYQDGAGRGVALARALIRVDNLPSQRAFQRVGFTTDRQVHHLLLWPPGTIDVPAPCPQSVSLVPVDTLTYRGLWIEGLTRVSPTEQRSAVRIARARIAREDRLNTGSLVPSSEEDLLTPDVRDQAKLHGRYYWFVRRPRSEDKT